MVQPQPEKLAEMQTPEGSCVRLMFYRRESGHTGNNAIVILAAPTGSSSVADANEPSDQASTLQLALASADNVGCITVGRLEQQTFANWTRSCAHGLTAMLDYIDDRWENLPITLVSEGETCLLANVLLMKGNVSDAVTAQVNARLFQRITLVVNISGLSDLTTLVHWCRYNGCSALEINEMVSRFGDISAALLAAAGTKESMPAMISSPLFYVRKGLPRFVLLHNTASRSRPFQQSKALYTFLRRKKVGVALYLFAPRDFESNRHAFAQRCSKFLKWSSQAAQSSSPIVISHPDGDHALTGDNSSTPYEMSSDAWVDPIDVGFDKVVRRRITSKVLGTEVEIGVYLPPTQSSGSLDRLPVIYWLPGADQTLRAGFFFVELLDCAIARGDAPQSIVVLLQRPTEESEQFARVGVTGFDSFVTAELLPFIDGEYRTIGSSSGRFLEGVCSGANAALRLGLSAPRHFSAVSAIAPYWGRWNALLTKAVGEDPAVLATKVMPGKLRMRIVAGTKDSVWNGARSLAAHFEAGASHVQFVSISGIGRNAIGIYDRLGSDAFSFFRPLAPMSTDVHECVH